jgi:hypothetical protein
MELHESHEYQRLLDEARVDLAVESRERQRVLELVQRESATLVGTLLDLADRGADVHVRLDTGVTVTGTVDLVGTGLVAVGGTWLRPDALVTVRPLASATAATGDRSPVTDLDLAGVLARMAPDRPRVVLLVPGEPVRGELVAVGEDVVTLRLDGDDRAVAYVPVAAVRGVRTATS